MSNIKPSNFLKTLQIYKAFQRLTSPSTESITTETISPTQEPIKAYKRSSAPTALPLSKIITTKLFPLSMLESINDFRTRKNLDIAQENLLKTIPFVTDPNDFRTAQVLKIDIGGGNYINEFVIKPKNVDYSKLNHFVLIHGYGAGLGFFLKNFDKISTNKNWCIHSLDLLGYGCSSRPKFDKKHTLDKWFVDSLEAWRIKRNIPDMLMCSHSLGAYMSILYTIKYPGNVKKLMLISPAGIIKPPNPPSNIPIWFNYLWEQNVSPFSLVRNAGPFGSMVTSGWTSRRFAKLSKKEQFYLHKYTYSIFNAPGSGEYFMSQILGAGGVPKTPMVERIDDIECDSVWCYGDEDWMPKEGGLESLKKIKQKGKYNGEFKVIENSGHHIYLDNYDGFNELCLDEMKNYEKTYKH